MTEHAPNPRTRRTLGIAMLASVVAAVALGAWSPRPVLIGYLAAFRFWLDCSLGCLIVLMIHALTGGRWGWSLRRALGAGMATIPIVAVAFIVVLLGMGVIYGWGGADPQQGDALVQMQPVYLRPWFFAARALVFWALWVGLGLLVGARARRQDEHDDDERGLALARVSAPGLVLMLFTVTFAGDDWFSSFMPPRLSTISGLQQITEQFVSAGALCIAVVLRVHRWPGEGGEHGLLARVRGASAGRAASASSYAGGDAPADRLCDLGTMLLTAVALLGYTAVSRLIIVWSGNLPREVGWYLDRIGGVWTWITIALVLTQLALPLTLLLLRRVKQSAGLMGVLVWMILGGRVVHSGWLVIPEAGEAPWIAGLAMVFSLGAIGCAWALVFLARLGATPEPARMAPILERMATA